MLEQFKEINEFILASRNAKEKTVNQLFIKEAAKRMTKLKNDLIQKLEIDETFLQGNMSIGIGNIASSPWIGFFPKKNENNPNGIYITLIFLPETKSIFLTIHGKSKPYIKSSTTLYKVFEFYQELFVKIKNKYNFLWNNFEIPEQKLVKDKPHTWFTNSYLFTSIFYELIELEKINDNELIEKISYIYKIFKETDLFYEYPEIIEKELNDRLSA